MDFSRSSGTSNEIMEKKLFKSVMSSEWEEVIRIYEADHTAHTAQITRLGHTALHMAVSRGKGDVVEKLVEAIKKSDPNSEALAVGEEMGNTPLHFAAGTGKYRMCECIARADRRLVGARNKIGETPLFWAVLYGHKKAFNVLNNTMLDSPERDALPSYYRRFDGHTILHCAIFAEDFDWAIHIIELNKGLVNIVDESGNTPLHILASNPSCFKSGFRFWNKIIFNSTLKKKKDSAFKEEMTGNCPGSTEINIEQDETDKLSPIPETSKNNTVTGFIKFSYKFAIDAVATCFQNAYKGQTWIDNNKHAQASKLLKKLLEFSTMYDNIHTGENPYNSEMENIDDIDSQIPSFVDGKKTSEPKTRESAILVAARNGIQEMVERILENFPVAIYDTDKDNKNLLLVAAQYRQWELYQFLLSIGPTKGLLVRKVDNLGNTALHLAATLKENTKRWPIPGAALQMQREIKWFKFVEKSLPPSFSRRPNQNEETPKEIFTTTHKGLLKEGSEWLMSTSSQCFIVATLIATVAFASSTTVPGGNVQSGKPVLENQPTFGIFTISSLVALGSSATSFIMFLSILTSRHEEKDFNVVLPSKLLLGLTSLFVSIVAMLTSFCSGHFIWLEDKYKHAAYLVYTVAFLPICIFAVAQFPLYVDLANATLFRKAFSLYVQKYI